MSTAAITRLPSPSAPAHLADGLSSVDDIAAWLDAPVDAADSAAVRVARLDADHALTILEGAELDALDAGLDTATIEWLHTRTCARVAALTRVVPLAVGLAA